jgi:hypothetical protein
MQPIILIVLVLVAVAIAIAVVLFRKETPRDFPNDAPKGQIHNPPTPFLNLEAAGGTVGLLFVLQPSSHLCYHEFIFYHNNGGLQLDEGDEVEFETRTRQVDVSGTPQNMYYAVNLRKAP